MSAAARALLLLGALAACSDTPAGLSASAEEALRDGRFADARSFAERGLEAAGPQAPEFERWTLNRVRLEAIAGAGDAPAVIEELLALQPAYPQRVDSSLWVRLGRAALQAGHLDAAITILEGGHERFPAEAGRFEEVLLDVRAAAEAGADDETLERLSQIPYLR